MTITSANLQTLAPKSAYATWAPVLTTAASGHSITTPLRMAHWIAQLLQESTQFTVFEDNLYSLNVARIFALSPQSFKNHLEAANYVGNAASLGNKILNGLKGNAATGTDGDLFHGRGPFRITGRTEYTLAGTALSKTYATTPTNVLTPADGALTAAWFFSTYKLCLPFADKDDIVSVTRAITGSGTANIDARKTFLRQAKAIWH